MRRFLLGCLAFAWVTTLCAQTFVGTNAPGGVVDFSVQIGTGATNLAITLNGDSSGYSLLLLRKGVTPTETSYDFASSDPNRSNALFLENPELSAGTWHIRIKTPVASPAHRYQLVVQTNRTDLRGPTTPVTKPLNGQFSSIIQGGSNQFFRVHLLTNMTWRISLDSTNLGGPDLYVHRGQTPTVSSFLKKATGGTNDSIAFNPVEGLAGVYYIGVFGSSAPATVTEYILKVAQVIPIVLNWDPGTEDLGTLAYTNLSGLAGDYYFKITTANPSAGAWRTALRLLSTNDANVYLSKGTLPTPSLADFKSERQGPDGMVLGLTTQFLPSEDWYILVRARANAPFALVSGAPYVTDLGTVAADGASGSGPVQIGPEGMRFFRTSTTADMLGWRLYLNGADNPILVRRSTVPLENNKELSQTGQMLMVPPALTVGQYFLGIPGAPGTTIDLDSRPQHVQTLNFGEMIASNNLGYGYSTYRVVVPSAQLAWQMYLPSTNGNPNFAVRRNFVPNEGYNDAYSDLSGTNTVDNITLVPPTLSDGTFYITVYCTNTLTTNNHHFVLQNGPAVVTDIDYLTTITNDDPDRVGWRYYRVTDIRQQTNSLCWTMLLSNSVPGTRIALRRNAAPSIWNFRNPSFATSLNYDRLSVGAFLQNPDHQSDIYYIGVYSPSNRMGPFVLTTQSTQPQPLVENVPLTRTNIESGRWEFFSVELTEADIRGQNAPGPILGLEVRLQNVTSGMPRIVMRREQLPTSFNSTVQQIATSWLSGQQLAAGADWTKRTWNPDGTVNEDGRILSVGVGRPLQPGKYYIGVVNQAGTNDMSYQILSRWIGPGRSIPVTPIVWNGGKSTNSVSPREAKYYQVVIPTNTPSWKVELTPRNGEVMLVAATNRVPSCEMDKRVQKPGKEHYVQLPAPSRVTLTAGTNYLLVVGEGQSPTADNRIGEGATEFVLESVGTMPEIDMGFLTGPELTVQGSVEAGESIAYHFTTLPTTMGFYLTLEDTTGFPVMVSHAGADLPDPGLGVDLYGNEGGTTAESIAASHKIIWDGAARDQTVIVKARQLGTNWYNASYTLRVTQIFPGSLGFDGGVATIQTDPSEYATFYKIEVPENAMGWDLRLTNVLSGNPRIVVRLEALPIKLATEGFNSDPAIMSSWPNGAQWYPYLDWTGRSESSLGTNETGRLLAVGRGRPLLPGLYTVAVIGNGYDPVSATLVSRGIGEGYSIPIKDLNFTNGTDTVTGLAPREAKYYRVFIPTNTPSWKVQLANLGGENMMAVLFDTLPNIGTQQDRNATNSAGRRLNRVGNEHFVMLPPEGGTQLMSGYYYIAVVGEGEASTNYMNRVGPNTSSYTIKSVGISPVISMGAVGSTELVHNGSLEGGETQIYEFTVPSGVRSMELRLDSRTGNPVMTLRQGAVPSPGASSTAGVQPDNYGNDGGEKAQDASATFISLANPTNGIYRLAIKARSANSSLFIPNATYTLRVVATDFVDLSFDQGVSVVENQAPATWRYFRVIVPANAFGWDLRLTDVKSGLPRLVVRRETLPDSLNTTSGWNSPGTTYSWPTNHQYAAGADWTKRKYSNDGTADEDGRVFALGLGRPLEPGTYYIGVRNSVASTNMSYTIRSRGIGAPYSIPIYELPYIGSHTNLGLLPREAAYYRVVIPSNAPSWKVKLTNLAGESMLAILRNALPNSDTVNANGDSTSGKGLQKPGNEHFVILPKNGTTNIQPATNFLAVISEGKNPPTSRIGSGGSDYVLSSLGTLPITDMGLLTSEDLVKPETLEDGEVKAYQFEVPYGTYGFQVMLEGRSGNPVAAVIPGSQMPDPGASGLGQAQDFYGNEGGYQAGSQNTPPYVDVHSNIVTVANPNPGMFSLAVKGRVLGGSYQNAAFKLRIKEVLVPELNFSESQNTNGLSNEVMGLLQNNERAFFKFTVPATNNGQPVIGWKLDLIASSGNPSMRVCRNVLPSDKDSSSLMDFATGTAIIAPPYLTNGVWFVEVKASGSSSFTLRSTPLELQRPPWEMPGPLDPVQTPGVQPPDFADSSVATNGLPLPPGGILLEQGSLHYYAIQVPDTNSGLLQMTLEALDGNPDLYLRVGSVPTLSHRETGSAGSIYERSMTSVTNTEYANWVPLDGKLEAQLRPGLWYVAVKAAGNTQAKYRLTASRGDITDLPIHGPAVVNQEVRPGNWKYFRVQMPDSLPLTFSVNFSQQSGDVVLHLRDTVPPGNGASPLSSNLKDWSTDLKNYGPYPSYDAPNTYTFTTPQVRPGQPIYLGFRAPVQATFNVQVMTNGASTQEPVVVAFYGGSGNTVLAPHGTAVFRVDVPPEATRWKHIAAHVAEVTAILDQGSIPNRSQRIWMSSSANSSYSSLLVGQWDSAAKQYRAGTWPWVPGHSYFMFVTNSTATAQEFTLTMDGRNAATDDNDTDNLPDQWEYLYFGYLGQNADGDSDADTRTNLEEYQQGTNPVDANSYRARLLTSAARGTIMRSPDLPNYELGSTVTLTPIPSPGYAFIGWSGSITSSANPLVLTMDGHKDLVATFKLAGDNFSTALALNGTSASVIRTNLGFTKETGEPFHAGNPGGKSIWWRWVAPTSGDFTLSTAGTAFNTLLAVYTGTSVSSLTHISSDNNSLGDTNGSNVKFSATQGTTYFIAVDGHNGASGRIQLSLAGAVSVPDAVLGVPQVLAGGVVRFNLSAAPNRSYQVQYSTNLTAWYDLGVVTASSTGTVTVDDQSAPGKTVRFYRVTGQ